jgi:nitrogen regulatory protein P-II 2
MALLAAEALDLGDGHAVDAELEQGGAEYTTNLLPKVKIEVAVADAQVASVVGAIRAAANTNAIGDGKIFVSAIEQMMRIRTGETAEAAI